MRVHRITTEHGSHIEPPLDPTWPAATKLRWHAAIVTLDTGLNIRITEYQPGQYNLTVGRTGTGPFTYDDAWTYLNGIDTGASEARRADDRDKEPTP